jgi:hypothetical protein
VLVAKAKSVLGLVDDASTGSSVDMLILGATNLVRGGLGVGLLAVGDNTAEREESVDVLMDWKSIMLTERSCRWYR